MDELNKNDIQKLLPYLNGVISMKVDLLKRKGEIVKQVILEYVDGSKKIANINKDIFTFRPYAELTSVNEYISRGIDGKSNYPGNCPGQIIEQYISYCKNKLGEIFFADPMEGGGTSVSVAKRLNIPYWSSDLKYGFNVMEDLMPKSSNCIWVHPPYFVGKRKDGKLSAMPRYSGVAWGNSKDINLDDGSHIHDWPKYISWLNTLEARLYQQLRKNGYLGMLFGASKVDGVYYDPITEMDIYGDVESIIIKKQTNCASDNTQYSSQRFIPIVHEYLLIIKKKDNLIIPCKVTKHLSISILQSSKITWKALVANVMEHLGGKATIDQLLDFLKNHPKAESNNHLREKVRQILNSFRNEFVKVKDGLYELTSIGKQLIPSVVAV